MAILVDLNQVMVSTLMVQIGFSNKRKSVDLNEHFLRHMVLNTIRSYKVKFSKEFGEMIICCDSKVSWRKNFFPFYKANRTKTRQESGLNWKEIFQVFSKIREEIKEFLPYKVIEVELAEADDIIATLTKHLHKTEPVLILSSDKDFKQLSVYPNVTQYSPRLQAKIKEKHSDRFLKEHIIRGDVSDGIPNMLSSDDAIINKNGKKNLSTKKVESWIDMEPEDFCITDEMMRGWKRNETLIDLSFCPSTIQDEIMTKFNEDSPKVTKRMTMDYFMSKGLRNLLSSVSEF